MNKFIPFLLCLSCLPTPGESSTEGNSSDQPSSSGGTVGASSTSGRAPTTSASSEASGEVETSSGTSSSSGEPDTSGGSMGGTGEVCSVSLGDLWGPCIIDVNTNTFACNEGFCQTSDLGSICVGFCDQEQDPCDGNGCGDATCQQTGACVLTCPCSMEGMVCDPVSNQCVWAS